MQEGRKPLSQLLHELCEDPREEVTVWEIAQSFGRRAFGALLFVFAIANLRPVPPGSSTVLGAPLMLLSPQGAIGSDSHWLPRFMRERHIKIGDLHRAFKRFLPFLEKIERLSRPRLFFLFGPVGDRVIGLVCTLLAFVLILPIPLGNLLPAFTIGALALALFQRDGIIALFGYACAAASTGLLVLSASAVVMALRKMLAWFGV